MIYVCCKERRECVKGNHPLYVASITMNLLTVSKGLSPESEWRKYPRYKACWKRWWRPQGCTIEVYDKMPEGYNDVTNDVLLGYAELMSDETPVEKFVENYWQ